ncbi:hypothetical protein PMAYCL1PPCAC_11970, partial [Pristionchus mayeri]
FILIWKRWDYGLLITHRGEGDGRGEAMGGEGIFLVGCCGDQRKDHHVRVRRTGEHLTGVPISLTRLTSAATMTILSTFAFLSEYVHSDRSSRRHESVHWIHSIEKVVRALDLQCLSHVRVVVHCHILDSSR